MRKCAVSVLSVLLCLVLLAGCGDGTSVKNPSTSSNKQTSSDVVSSDNVVSDTEQTEADTDAATVVSGYYETVTSQYWQSYGESDYESSTLVYPDKSVEGNTCILINDVKGGANDAADKKRNEILSTTDDLVITGTKYYISGNGNDDNDGTSPEKAWKTTDAIAANSADIKSGDAVLFERGYIYRTNNSIVCKSGVTYAAYGTGDKPMIYGSVENYSQPGYWEPSNKKNVWKLNLPLTDAGIIVFNNGEAVGTKKTGLLSLTQNGDFYHNSTDNTFYLYLDKGRPNQVYDSIEIGTRRAIFTLQIKVKDVRIDNIGMKYTGTFGVQCIGYHDNVHITNCEIGWIGGSYQNPDATSPSRYGNGIQFWDSASNCSIKNCWVYQVYDAGITFQSNDGQVYENIYFDDNLIEYCSYNIEFFLRPEDQNSNYVPESEGKMINIHMDNNILRMAGYGWGSQRDNSSNVSSINGWDRTYEGVYGFSISGNIFDCSTHNLVIWGDTLSDKITVSGNSFYQSANSTGFALYWASDKQLSASNQSSLEAAVAKFDSNPKTVKWVS